MIGALLSLIIFVTDCDNTLVHYNTSKKGNDSFEEQDLISMPASSGSGQVASVSTLTIARLNDIAQEGVDIICATGMRATTMLQREKHFPCIKYWACENGGRIFYRVTEGEAPVEIASYSKLLLEQSSSKYDLEAFGELLRSEGWNVDDKGYLTMVRVKGLGLEKIINRIPDTLQHTFNLGHLDIQLPGCGKLAAVRWILKNHLLQLRSRMASTSVNVDASSLGTLDLFKVDTNATFLQSESSDDMSFLFMGDDDNDIEIAAASKEAFITKPCSKAMQSFIDKFNSGKKTSSSEELSSQSDSVIDSKEEEKAARVHHIYEAPHIRHQGTEALLETILEKVRTQRSE